MPYAQSYYPFENKKQFEATFPADFIAGGVDQTRGWYMVCPSVCLSVYLCLSVCLCLFVCQFVHLCMSVCVFLYLCICLCMCVHELYADT